MILYCTGTLDCVVYMRPSTCACVYESLASHLFSNARSSHENIFHIVHSNNINIINAQMGNK